MIESRSLEIRGADESGIDVSINGVAYRPKMLMVGGELPPAARKVLGLPQHWDAEVLHRYTFLKLKGTKLIDPAVAKMIPMSLDLDGKLLWAWVLIGSDAVLIGVEQTTDTVQKLPPLSILRKWIDVLMKHRVLKAPPKPFDLTQPNRSTCRWPAHWRTKASPTARC